jgi:hypothetical protein
MGLAAALAAASEAGADELDEDDAEQPARTEMPSRAVALTATMRPVRVMMNSFDARAPPQRLKGIYPMHVSPKPVARA